jgi:type II secretory pathway pseudopilin PulG
MKRVLGARDGFMLYELMLVMALTTILAGLMCVNFADIDRVGREAELKSNVARLRVAIDRYYQDHGFYPCGNEAGMLTGDPEIFEQQLEWYTDAEGRVSREKTEEFCFGPYLNDLPEEVLTGSDRVVIDTRSVRTRPSLAAAVAGGSGEGGWYYEPKSGNLVANLGTEFNSKYTQY